MVHYLIYVDIKIIYILEEGRQSFIQLGCAETKSQAQMSRYQFLADTYTTELIFKKDFVFIYLLFYRDRCSKRRKTSRASERGRTGFRWNRDQMWGSIPGPETKADT